MRVISFLLALVAAACSSSTELLPDGGRSSGVDFGLRATPTCGGVACGDSQICCFSTGLCYSPATSTCGVTGVDAGTSIINPRRDATAPPCGSDADCRDDEFCNGLACGGGGVCFARDNCGTCYTSPPPVGHDTSPPDPPLGTECQVCGCNGVTYAAPQLACRAGVRVTDRYTGPGACGAPPGPTSTNRVACGNDAQCPAGKTCCAYYGFCMDATCTYCCQPPPPGASLPCTRSDECDGSEYCAGDGCGTVGGCVHRVDSSSCSGELAEVCGCDGHDYTNSCWAFAARTRVAHTGRCGD